MPQAALKTRGQFSVTLNLDTPSMISGALSGKPDRADVLRPETIRGSLRFWCRALLGPMVNGDTKVVHTLEAMLFGEAAAEDRGHRPLRIQGPVTQALEKKKYPVLPHDPERFRRDAFLPNQERTIVFRPSPAVLADPAGKYREVLWAITWTALVFGAMGQRSRRGYGGLSPVAAEDLPQSPIPEGSPLESLPLFSELPSNDRDLGYKLYHGLSIVQHVLYEWVKTKAVGSSICPSLPPYRTPQHAFFQLADAQQVYLGRPYTSDNALMDDFMDRCSSLSGDATTRQAYSDGFGSAAPRLGSPIILRIHPLAGGQFLPVVTYSRRIEHTQEPVILDGLLAAVGAIDAAGLRRTLDTFKLSP